MWSCYLFHVRSGNLGPRIEPTSLSWDMTINDIESLDLTLKKNTIPKLETPLWLEPWWSGVALFYGNTPIIAGPITTRPTETFFELKIKARGIRAVFEKRSVVPDMRNWNDLLNGDKVTNWATDGPNGEPTLSKFRDISYASLARLAVESSLSKHGGDLPIRFRTPITAHVDPPTVNGIAVPPEDRPHYRRYAGYHLLNDSVENALQELSEIENGPDIMFRPVLVSGRIMWDMWTGTSDAYPELPQESDTVWDTTAQAGYISDLELIYTGTQQTNRAFVSGTAGTGGGVIRMSQNTARLNEGYPLLESAESMGGADNESKFQEKASANLKANDKPRHQLNAKVRVDGINQMGTFWPGEYGKLITSGWYGLRNGETRAKILSMSGDLTSSMDITFKETEVI